MSDGLHLTGKGIVVIGDECVVKAQVALVIGDVL